MSSTVKPETKYEVEFVNMMKDVDTMIDGLQNPHHRRIMINFRRHGLLEVSGRYEELLGPEMTVRHPHYRIFEGGQATILDGMQQVSDFYKALADMNMLVMWISNPRFGVHDRGFSGETEFNQFVPGRLLGDNVFGDMGEKKNSESEYDPDEYYHVKRTLCFAWPYTEAGLMIGENVYEDSASKVITKVNKQDVIYLDRARELVDTVLDKYTLNG